MSAEMLQISARSFLKRERENIKEAHLSGITDNY